VSLELIEEGNPESRIELSDEQIGEFRQAILAEYRRQRGDDNARKITRRNGLWLKVERAVEMLDAAGFAWGQALDAGQKAWAVRWMSWSLRARKHRTAIKPQVFVEIF
jgi:hypothetical protein